MGDIRYYPSSYVISEVLKAFFIAVTKDEELQGQLYETKKISDVADIARERGFNIRASEVLQAQAGRVLAILEEETEDVDALLSGLKPKTGAQWGRGGGFLDKAGYWLIALANPISSTKKAQHINEMIEKIKQEPELKEKCLLARSFNDVAFLCSKSGFDITATELLLYQAQKILALTQEEAEKVANSYSRFELKIHIWTAPKFRA